jgi:hypothetical protein
LQDAQKEIQKIRGAKQMDSANAETNLKALEKFCKNLTALAKAAEPVTVTTEPKAEAASKEDLPIYILAILFLAAFVALKVWKRK